MIFTPAGTFAGGGRLPRPCSSRCWFVSSSVSTLPQSYQPPTSLTELLPLVHHVLEGISEKELPAFAWGTLQDVLDPVEQRAPILHILQADIGPLGNRRIGLLDDLGHVTLLVRHDDAETLIVLDFLGPDDAVVTDKQDRKS